MYGLVAESRWGPRSAGLQRHLLRTCPPLGPMGMTGPGPPGGGSALERESQGHGRGTLGERGHLTQRHQAGASGTGGEVFHRTLVTAAFPLPTCLLHGHPGPAKQESAQAQEGSPATRGLQTGFPRGPLISTVSPPPASRAIPPTSAGPLHSHVHRAPSTWNQIRTFPEQQGRSFPPSAIPLSWATPR